MEGNPIVREMKGISQAVAEEQARLRWMLSSGVSEALQLSESEIREASKDLLELQHEVQQNADSARAAMALVGKEAEVVEQIFGSYPVRYAEEVAARLRQQIEAAERALRVTEQIGAFVGEIGKISNAVRVLTINGYIESTRLGGEGRAFAVIAEQLQELGEKVRSANEGIRELTASLDKLIPQIGDGARMLLRTTEQLESEHNDAMFIFHGASSAARRDLTSALQEQHERLQRAARRAGRALEHLRFQDRLAQQLRQIETFSFQTEKVLATMFEQLLSGAARDPGSALVAARQAHAGWSDEQASSRSAPDGQAMTSS
ncbi:MAG: methyl-accepting chemotaxis protein [Myxococcales bacterium]|nr:methyl-accepting chemotaxis protein [Myxococcota bacterium]MDW8284184.1 methyl-accepting chemotaxis protein [Myxococcales bacterium]